ncbi:MAG: hypothetical protein IVW54_04925 [Candidatus Binataceae bacterium]|nr:hypothetical protein [Candidatus Binataceae bacterium]
MNAGSNQVPEVTQPLLIEAKLADGQIELSLTIPPELIYFRGHFPGFAILPGVVQIEWVMGYSKRYFKLGDSTARTMQIKFRQLIRPGDRLQLTLTYQPAHSQIQFVYANAEGTLSSGRIGLEPL